MLIYGTSRLQALARYARVKQEKLFPLTLYMIIEFMCALGKIQPITSAQNNSSGHVDTFVILDLNMFSYIVISSNPASRNL